MRSSATAHSKCWLGILPLILMLSIGATQAYAQTPLTFTKAFGPDTIGPGSVTTLTFTITNNTATAADNLAFTDVLPISPAAMTIASPAAVVNTCNGAVTAPDGGSTIELSGGQLAPGAMCTITVNVTAPAVDNSNTNYTNTSGTLTSSIGSGDTATDDLLVDVDFPGFTKEFSPSSVSVGGRSTLTFTIDNTANGSAVPNLDFTDNLPVGMEIADPANASTTCGEASATVNLTATAGTNVIILDVNGIDFAGFRALAAGATCTVTVDVVATGAGPLGNVSEELLADFVSAGKASATLEVTITTVSLIKEFTDDPTPPGGMVTLDFTIENFDRDFPASGVAFTDDLTTALAGLTFDSLLSNDCGGTVTGVSGTAIGFSGGTVPAEGSCTISVSLLVPAGATPGQYTNTTGAITATVDGSPVEGNTASDDLFVAPAPILTKEFLEVGTLAPDPVVNPGDDVVLRFTVTNTSTTSMATDIAFFDELTDGSGGFPPDPTSGFLPFPVTVTLPPVPDPPCGAGSSLALVTFSIDRQRLELTGGSLDPEDSCTFEVTLTIPATFPPGIYTNTTEEITATVDGATRTGEPASDDITIIAAPQLTKAFTDDPVAPGGTVTLEFTLTYPPDASGDATDITFTDDLSTVLTGLVGDEITVNDVCGTGNGTISWSVNDTFLTFSDGTLAPGEVCTFSVTLTVPAGAAPGSHTNTTSDVMATVDGTAITGPPASDDLEISSLNFTKEFLDNPVIAGATTTLRFTIENVHPTEDATITFFSDNLQANLPGLAATGAPSLNECGGTLSGTTFLIYTGGSVTSGTSCNIEVEVLVPVGAADGTYANITSSLSANQGGAVTVAPARDNLVVNSTLLELTKEFTDNPVAPGGTGTLRFTLTNLDTVNPATAIAFSDDLEATLTGLEASGALTNECGGMAAGFPTDLFEYTGGSLAAGASCDIVITLTVPGSAANGTIATNTTSGVTGTITGLAVFGDPATDELVISTSMLTLSKAFDGPTEAGGTPQLTITITNADETGGASLLAFSDDLNAALSGLVATGLPMTDVCGAGSEIAGTGFLSLTGGDLGPSESCDIVVDLMVPPTALPGVYTNTTSALFLNGVAVADPATADLTVEGPLGFSKAFVPATIGVGSVSMLTFTITNPEAVGVTALAFTDNLPAAMTIATPAAVVNECGGTVTAPDGGATIELSGGLLPAGSSCTITVNVTSNTVGTHTNTTGNLFSSLAPSETATADLTVATDRPGFTKSFSPNPVTFEGRSTLTFTIDNSANDVAATDLTFTDTLPSGMTVADPANASTSCTGGVLMAAPGANLISYGPAFSGDASVGAASSCTISVDVIGGAIGLLGNTTDALTSDLGSSGKAGAVLEVSDAGISLVKTFTDDPTAPGGTVTLEFTILNLSRTLAATDIAFDDDLTFLTDLAAVGLPATNVCGAGSEIDGTTSLSFTGGNLPAEGSCTFSVTLQVPAAAPSGTYTNTTTAITGTTDGEGITGNIASDDLFVAPVPTLTKTFLDNPVGSGGTTRLEFTITNTSTTSTATDIEFTDEFDVVLPTASVVPADGSCGAGSDFTFTPLNPLGFIPATLTLSGGELPPSGSCTFEITLNVATGAAPGTYSNTTSEITATVSEITVTGSPATDDLDVVAPPSLVKEFTDDPVLPGGTVTLEFTLTNDDADNAASDIEFTDDLDATLSGLVAVGPLSTGTCDGTLTGTSLLTYSGGSLAAGASCTFSVTLTVPDPAAAGAHTNETSNVTATVNGVSATGNTATDDLTIGSLTLTKEFIDDPVAPGGTVMLRFTIENVSPTLDATDITFDDDLDATLTDLVATGLPVSGCGGTLNTSDGGSTIEFTGGTLAAGAPPCTFSVTLNVPAGAASDTYPNTTSGFQATIDGVTVVLDNASDALIVAGDLLELTKAFTDDPVMPGSTVTLEFTLTNLDGANAASAIAFTDDLDAVITGLVATGLPASACGGTSNVTGTDTITFTGGVLAAGASCTFSVTLDVPSGAANGTYINTTSGVTGTISGLGVTGDPASDDLEVNDAALILSKSFDGPTTATGTPVLTFTITNNGDTALSDLGFTDNLNAVIAGLVATNLPLGDVCGAGSLISGTSTLTFTGGNLGANSSCSFDVELLVPESATAGTFTNTTSELFVEGIPLADPATDDLTVEPPPTFAKVFDPDAILFQGISTLTFTIDNTASALAASSLDFTDNLPAGVEVAGTPNASTTCTGGTLTATAGTGVITYTGGSVAAGASCTVSVDVTGTVAGAHVNTTGDLTSSSGNSGTASDTLTVADPPDIAVTKTDDGEAAPGDAIGYTVVITNSGGGATDVVFNDTVDGNTTLVCNLPTTPTTTQGTITNCDDTTGEVIVDVGTLAASASVTITFEATVDDPIAAAVEEVCNQGTASGSNFDDVDSDDPDTGDAGDATCTVINAAPDLTLTKDDGDATVLPGNDVAYTLTYENAGTQDATGVVLTETVPDNTTFNATASTTGWTCTPDDTAGSACTLAVGDLAAGAGAATATFAVTVDNPVPAGTTEITNTASIADDEANGADPNPDDNEATDTTPVDAMPEVMALKSDALTDDVDDDGQADPGDTITYTIVITNNGDEDATDVVFTDLATDHPNTTLVDGSVTTTQGTVDSGNGGGPDTDVMVSVGMIAGGGGTATITFDVVIDGPLPAGVEEVCNQGLITDNFPDTPTDDPDSGGAADPTCTPVDAAPDLTLTKDDGGATAMPGDDVAYTLTYENAGTQDATGVVLTETVPDNTTFNATASTTGWTCTPDDTAGSACTLAVGDLAAGAGAATATFAVTVDNPVPAGTTEITNTASIADDEANGADPNPDDNEATDTTPIDAMPGVTAQKGDALTDDGDSDGQADPGDTITYTVVITNNGDEDATDVVFTDTVDGNTTLVCNLPTTPTTSQGSITACDPTTGTVGVDVGMIAGGGGSATITIDVVINGPLPAGVEEVCNQGLVTDNFPDVPTDDPDVGGAADPTCTPVDAAPDLTLAKDDGGLTAQPGQTVPYTLTYENVGTQDATGVVLTETVPDNTTFNATASTPGWTCTPDGSAGNTCTLAVGDLAAGAGAATATFAVTVDNPVAAGVTQISNTATVADDEANGADPNPDDNTAQDTTPIDAMAEISATLTDALVVDVNSNGIVDPGDTIRYTAVVANDGSRDASNVGFEDLPDANTTLVNGSVTTTQGTVVEGNDPGDTTVEVDLTTLGGEPQVLASQAAATITFDVTINSPLPLTVTEVQTQGVITYDDLEDDVRQAVAQTVTDDPDTPQPLDPTKTMIGRSADLAVTKTASIPTVPYYTEVVFTIQVTNNGPTGPAGADVEDVLPAGLVYVSHTVSQGTFNPQGKWNTDGIAVGSTATLTITARVETVLPVTNTATIKKASLPDPNETNNSASVTITPIAADLAIVKRVIDFEADRNTEPDSIRVTFEAIVINNGPSDATGVLVTDAVPVGARFITASASQGAYNDSLGVWIVGAVPNGGTATLTVWIAAAADNNLFNRAEVSADQPDPNLSNNLDGAGASHDRGDGSNLVTDLSLTKTVDNETPNPGDLITYTLVVSNNGPNTNAGVEVSERLPAGLEFVSATTTSAAGRCATCGYDDSLGVWIVGHLPVDSTAVIEITVRVTGAGPITNTATVQGNLPEPQPNFIAGFNPFADNTASATITVSTGKAVAAVREGADGTPTRTELGKNYPNPFNPDTVIPFGLPEAEHVTVEVFNLIGQRVALLLDQSMAAGRHEVVWRATNQPSGLYLVRLRAGTVQKIQRVTLVK